MSTWTVTQPDARWMSRTGGNAGFVRIDGNVLTIPDFAGNLHFNTLGNFLLNPRAGLVFINFETGDMLQVSGRTEIILEGPQIAAFQGAERLWTLTVEQVVRRQAVLALRWRFEGFSPNSLLTGSWEQAEGRLQADALRDQWRPLRVTRIVDESSSIRSFYFEPADGAGIPRFEAGQHLPVRFCLAEGQAPQVRTYSLSSAPSDSFFASASSVTDLSRPICMTAFRSGIWLKPVPLKGASRCKPMSIVRWFCWPRAWA